MGTFRGDAPSVYKYQNLRGPRGMPKIRMTIRLGKSIELRDRILFPSSTLSVRGLDVGLRIYNKSEGY